MDQKNSMAMYNSANRCKYVGLGILQNSLSMLGILLGLQATRKGVVVYAFFGRQYQRKKKGQASNSS